MRCWEWWVRTEEQRKHKVSLSSYVSYCCLVMCLRVNIMFAPIMSTDYCPLALTSLMNRFQKLTKNLLSLPNSYEPLQSAYRSRDDAALHCCISTWMGKNAAHSHTITYLTLVSKMRTMGLITTVQLDTQLTDQWDTGGVCGLKSDTLTTNWGAPQGYVFSPLLYNISINTRNVCLCVHMSVCLFHSQTICPTDLIISRCLANGTSECRAKFKVVLTRKVKNVKRCIHCLLDKSVC